MTEPEHHVLAVDPLVGAGRSSAPACASCGSHTARWWSTPDGRAPLCPPCATLHGLGCP